MRKRQGRTLDQQLILASLGFGTTATALSMPAQNPSTVNPYGLVHTTTLAYPVRQLLTANETPHLRPRAAALSYSGGPPNNYRPGVPLIRHPVVNAHTDRKSEAELSISIRVQAEVLTSEHGPYFLSDDFGWWDLVEDMKSITRYDGKSELAVMTTFNDNNKVLMKIQRLSRCSRAGAQDDWFDVKEYHFLRNNFDEYMQAEVTERPQWTELLHNLVERADHRSFLHVELRMHLNQWVEAEDDEDGFPGSNPAQLFLLERRENIPAILETWLRHLNVSEDEACNICGSGDFELAPSDNGDMRAVHSGCNNGHEIVHKSCLETLIAVQEWPSDTSCPHCRQKLLKDILLHNVQFALIDGIHYRDSRFTDWENFERSCADLDLTLAGEDETFIKPNGHVFWAIWQNLSSYTQWDIGDELDAAHTPEFRDMQEALTGWFYQIPNVPNEVRTLYSEALYLVYNVMANKYLRGAGGGSLSVGDRVRLLSNPAQNLRIAPGVKEHFERVLSRVLRFYCLRRCEECFPKKWCKHGERDYYHPWLQYESTSEGLVGEWPVENKESFGEFTRRGAVSGHAWLPEPLVDWDALFLSRPRQA